MGKLFSNDACGRDMIVYCHLISCARRLIQILRDLISDKNWNYYVGIYRNTYNTQRKIDTSSNSHNV